MRHADPRNVLTLNTVTLSICTILKYYTDCTFDFFTVFVYYRTCPSVCMHVRVCVFTPCDSKSVGSCCGDAGCRWRAWFVWIGGANQHFTGTALSLHVRRYELREKGGNGRNGGLKKGEANKRKCNERRRKKRSGSRLTGGQRKNGREGEKMSNDESARQKKKR